MFVSFKKIFIILTLQFFVVSTFDLAFALAPQSSMTSKDQQKAFETLYENPDEIPAVKTPVGAKAETEAITPTTSQTEEQKSSFSPLKKIGIALAIGLPITLAVVLLFGLAAGSWILAIFGVIPLIITLVKVKNYYKLYKTEKAEAAKKPPVPTTPPAAEQTPTTTPTPISTPSDTPATAPIPAAPPAASQESTTTEQQQPAPAPATAAQRPLQTSLTPMRKTGETEMVKDYKIKMTLSKTSAPVISFVNKAGEEINISSNPGFQKIKSFIETAYLGIKTDWVGDQPVTVDVLFQKNANQFEITPDRNTVILSDELFFQHQEDTPAVCIEAMQKGFIRLAQQNMGLEEFYDILIAPQQDLATKFPKATFLADENSRQLCIKLFSYSLLQTQLRIPVQEYKNQRMSLYKEPNAILIDQISFDEYFEGLNEQELARLKQQYGIAADKTSHNFKENDEQIFNLFVEGGISKVLEEMDTNAQIDTAVRAMA